MARLAVPSRKQWGSRSPGGRWGLLPPEIDMVWHLQTYEIHDDWIVSAPNSDTRHCNPSEFYFPWGKEPSLYLRLARIKEDDPTAILSFVNEFGLPYLFWDTWHDASSTQRKQIQSVIGDRLPELADFPMVLFQREIKALRGLITLWTKLRQRENRKGNHIHNGVSLYLRNIPPFEDQIFGDPTTESLAIELEAGDCSLSPQFCHIRAGHIFKFALNLRLLASHPQVWFQHGDPGQSWACRTLLDACYLMFYWDVVGNRILRHCEACATPFEAKRSDQLYHSVQCGSKVRQRRWRESHSNNNKK